MTLIDAFSPWDKKVASMIGVNLLHRVLELSKDVENCFGASCIDFLVFASVFSGKTAKITAGWALR